MFLGNEKKVYIMDKVEGNPTQINGHPAWAEEWDIEAGTTRILDMSTNTFCAAGMHLPNGSYTTFGGNGAVGPTGAIGSVNNGFTGAFDVKYHDWDGGKAIRIMDPCEDETCEWFDNSTTIQMQKRRWYPGCEALADGTAVLMGGFVNGGYINRNTPNTDPLTSGGAAEPSYEFFPPRGDPQIMQFMAQTSGLNSYAIMYLLPSGKMFMQANISTIVWDYNTNTETPLPDMPGAVVRVYPASGASTLLPLTPANSYVPTAIFCGGSNMTDDQWGNYTYPNANTWEIPASNDCQRITPEPLGSDGTSYADVAYEQDDDMFEGRTMGQFIILPDLTMLLVNGGTFGTAGYATATGTTPGGLADMPFGESLAAQPAFQPALYTPTKPRGQRWSRPSSFAQSTIPRLYHSSALLLPNGSVMIGGSNPNIDYNISTVFPTEYRIEYFYPPYFSATIRPVVTGIPATLTYGGPFFDLTVNPDSFSGSANDAASNTTVTIIRPGWTTHGINMGQRAMQLNNTYTVSDNGTITLHVSQPPPNPNLFQPGPVLFFVNVHGIPSIGKIVIVGSGNIETQPMLNAVVLPQSVLSTANVTGSADPASTTAGSGPAAATSESGSNISKGAIIAVAVGGAAGVALVAVFAAMCIAKRRKRNAARATILGGVQRSASTGRAYRDKEPTSYGPVQSTVPIPLRDYSQADLHAPTAAQVYSDATPTGSVAEFNPYEQQAAQGSHGYVYEQQGEHGYGQQQYGQGQRYH
ncbi:copper radical oxidase [Sphaerobolus stellatus SS14]|uniref:Copper radical oxidase n=1 Tax=Sphaerobolus stellatus (strain SS14) TaxID=990650 RepID=A0A0C9U625_SPHS4|nr:copper radical oxidase [Sphaerobolus stellatus SS14]